MACIGASAGGLEALTSLLELLPADINMAFVLVQHLEPLHKSALTEILSRRTPLNICEAKNGTKIECAHIYVIPPNALLSISGGKLKLSTRIKRPDGRYLPINLFMNSLAKDQGEKAIGIILSGTGSDGTLGVKAIKEEGGITFAQDERSARYYGMPGGAIASGSVDFIMTPREIARKLTQIGKHGHIRSLKHANSYKSSAEEGLSDILLLLRDRMGVDFVHYKQTTICRRVGRRMTALNIKRYADYHSYLKREPAEAEALLKNILISVTTFFRDPKVFEAIIKKAFPLITKERSAKDPIRIWVPACSSGEEVYSIAIALYEHLERKKSRRHIQIFGTDLSETLIAKARAGTYPEDISKNVSAERLRRFFVKTETGYKIAAHIRELCIFAKHDIISDPPLSHMDLESCRNLLIYLDVFLQEKVLSTLHYALKPAGILVLGTAESVSAGKNLFVAIDRKHKIYSWGRIGSVRKPNIFAPIAGTTAVSTGGSNMMKSKAKSHRRPVKPSTFSRSKRTGGKASLPSLLPYNKATPGEIKLDVSKLRKEFARAVDRLHALNEEKDTFNEELKAANEEIQSSNEELQSMNEELETSKEELQSTNEELLTLNEEFQNKNVELTRLNSDLNNIFASTNIPIIIVGSDLRIKRFTPTARKVMNLIPTDIERPIGDIKLNIRITDLESMLLSVVEDITTKELEVQDNDGRWYSMRIKPYRTVDNKIDGAVITMIDVDEIRRSREEAQYAFNYVQAIIETMREPLLVLDHEAHILSSNRSFCSMCNVQESELKEKRLYELNAHQWDNPDMRKLLGDISSKKARISDLEMSLELPKKGRRNILINGRHIRSPGGNIQMILLVMQDVTEQKKAIDVLKRDSLELEKEVKKRTVELLVLEMNLEREKQLSNIGQLAATIAHELRNTLSTINVSAYRIGTLTKDPKIEKSLNVINKMISEGDQIISNILSYSKIKVSHFEMVKINDILEFCINEIKAKLQNRGALIHEDIGSTTELLIEADPVQMKEVFCNILGNALDAVDKQNSVIEVESKVDGPIVSISIKDNGEGISSENLIKVLNPFFTTKSKGTGLGLAVCKQIIMLHDGLLDIESKKGKWTTVKTRLPIKRDYVLKGDRRVLKCLA